MERTRIEFCNIYIDATPPYIDMFGVTHNDEKLLFVHRTDTWFPDLKLHYHTWDPHSNIKTMEWWFGTTEDGDEVGSGAMPVVIQGHNASLYHYDAISILHSWLGYNLTLRTLFFFLQKCHFNSFFKK